MPLTRRRLLLLPGFLLLCLTTTYASTPNRHRSSTNRGGVTTWPLATLKGKIKDANPHEVILALLVSLLRRLKEPLTPLKPLAKKLDPRQLAGRSRRGGVRCRDAIRKRWMETMGNEGASGVSTARATTVPSSCPLCPRAGVVSPPTQSPIIVTLEQPLLMQKEMAMTMTSNQRPSQPLTYGNSVLDVVGFFIKVVAVVTSQVVGASLAIQEYHRVGEVSRTLMNFSLLLAGITFIPPAVVACRSWLPDLPARHPLRLIIKPFELILDTFVVASLALQISIIITALLSLPSYNLLQSCHLSEEYIRGALGAAVVYFFIWNVARQTDSLATKWFM